MLVIVHENHLLITHEMGEEVGISKSLYDTKVQNKSVLKPVKIFYISQMRIPTA